MPFAVWACHRTAQQAGVFGSYSEIELKPAARILTNCAVHDSLATGSSGFISGSRCLHCSILLVFVRTPRSLLVIARLREDEEVELSNCRKCHAPSFAARTN